MGCTYEREELNLDPGSSRGKGMILFFFKKDLQNIVKNTDKKKQ